MRGDGLHAGLPSLQLFSSLCLCESPSAAAATLTLQTIPSNRRRDYDSVSVSPESISRARLSASRIDGSYELLGGEGSNIGEVRIENLQQK